MYYVSTVTPSQGGHFRLRLPTRHASSYTGSVKLPRGAFSLKPAERRMLADFSLKACSGCQENDSCVALDPCEAVANLVLWHRALYQRALALVEHLFEDVRQSRFSDRPSRFGAFFCSESLQDALRFRNAYRAKNARVFAVEPAEGARLFRADMRWLNCALDSFDHIGRCARAYWAGEATSDQPHWELLVAGDLRVLEEVKK